MTYEELLNKYDDIVNELFGFIDQIASLIKDAIKNVDTTNIFNVLEFISKNIISQSVETAKLLFAFDRKYEVLRVVKKEIDFYNSKKTLISWIEQVFEFEVNDKIFGIRIETGEYYIKISNIYVDIFTI